MKKLLHGIMFVLVLFQSLAPAIDVAARQGNSAPAGQAVVSTPTPTETPTVSETAAR